MTERRNLKKELQYFVYNDPEYGEDIENIHYPALILILQDLVERVEQLEKDNELLKSYVWDGNGK
jgi:cell shape-determining protein MreC